MKYLVDPLLELNEYNHIIDSIKTGSTPVKVIGPSDSGKVHLSHAICSNTNQKAVYIAAHEMQAKKVAEDFSAFLGDQVLYFPAKEVMLHDVEAKSYDNIYERVSTLYKILTGSFQVVVASIEAIAHKLISPDLFIGNTLEFSLNHRVDLESVTKKLVQMGYERVHTVEAKGQFAVRGGILDVYPVNHDLAVRIELFDDEIDSIRSVDPVTQRSMDMMQEVCIIPARELLYPYQRLDAVVASVERDFLSFVAKQKGSLPLEEIQPKFARDTERIKNGEYFPGMDRYIPYIVDRPSTLFDYILHQRAPEDKIGSPLVFIDEPSKAEQRIENILLEYHEDCKNLLVKGKILPGCFDALFDYDAVGQKLSSFLPIHLNTFAVSGGGPQYTIPFKLMGSYHGNPDLLVEDIRHWKNHGYRIVVLSGTRGKGERLQELLLSNEIEAVYKEHPTSSMVPGQVVVTRGSLKKGFEYPSIGLVVVSDEEMFGQRKKARKSVGKKKKGDKIKAFTDLHMGDYVVHQTHGIGQYTGMEQLVVENIKKDYLKIRYKEGGFLYIPTNQLDLIQKYIGSEGKAPKLNKLGGSEWIKTKKKVKESLKELAEELVKLYAKRQEAKGLAFSKDTVWQKQFEDTFPYEETDDQLKCIEEVKKDMEIQKPMDRLLCGDVGYGKTEVAIRALFKAVMDGKQVAYLVPTTVLAQQHYNNFKQRLKDFPVTVEVMNRFRSRVDQKRILKDLKTGMIDVLVGTHRLIQKDIHFKDLGLLIIDEEQRFGVTHKEKIKNIKPNVDVLTLSATPIPRTLHMSLVGIRDISTLEDPPEGRYPVQTYVMEYDADVIKDAIYREMARQGQVFYLYNRVRSIRLKASEINTLVPEARVAVAHGQMSETELENVMTGFINGEYDVLVCTTIIESGLDMPNVNTIVVEDADRMGLSQLYQLRGRVGRSNKMAYAYITYKKDKVLAEEAEKRLQAIKEFTEFGSGFKIAMRDLEIRGAGNLLGPQQHGQMEAVGYDMYCKLLDDAVKELKGEASIPEAEEITVDINVSAYIDNGYISAQNQKIEMYKKIASIVDEEDVLDIEDELIDRYGEIPLEVKNLIDIAYIKNLARECFFTSIQEKNQAVILQYKDHSAVNIELVGGLVQKYGRRILFTASSKPYLTFKLNDTDKEKTLGNIKFLLQDIKKLQGQK